MVQIMKNEETRPASLAYISGYNEKSFELGMSFYNSGKFGIYILKEACLYCQKKYLDHYITHTDFTSDSKYTWNVLSNV